MDFHLIPQTKKAHMYHLEWNFRIYFSRLENLKLATKFLKMDKIQMPYDECFVLPTDFRFAFHSLSAQSYLPKRKDYIEL